MRHCFRCGAEVAAERRVLREDECGRCSQDLHCCRNCRFYDPGVSNQCSEPQAEWVADKERGNFCEFFVFADRAAAGGRAAAKEESARDRFNRLFKDP